MVQKLVNYLKTSVQELQKVTWPSRKETIQSTVLVITISLIVMVFLGVVDFGLTWVVEKITGAI
jgi:preprotein translocase subunit SecE